MLEGNRAEDIVQAIRTTYAEENPEQLINAAGDHFATVGEADTSVIRGWCLEAYREMYRRMVDIGDYAGALKAIKELMAFANRCSAPPNKTPPTPEG
jgi:hypothetical protein